MFTEEEKKKYKTLLLGIGIGMILGYLFSWLTNDPVSGKPQVGSFDTTFIGCFITVGFVLVYLYIAEWSDHVVPRGEKLEKEVA